MKRLERPHEPAGRPSHGKVLVLGSDTRSFLSVVRSLGRRGIAVHVAWHAPDSPAVRSRYVKRVHDIPAPWADREAWKHAFSTLLDEHQFDLVVPCNDPSLIPLQEHRAEFETRHRVYLLSDRAYEVAFDKLKSSSLAESLQIPVPRSRTITAVADGANAAADLGLPLVLKPVRSFSRENLKRKNHVAIVTSIPQLEQTLTAMLEAGPVVAQEYFRGTGAGVEFLADQGRILVAFQHVRLHEPVWGGGSSYRKSTPLSPELRAAAERLVAALDYTGVGMVEFRVDPNTERWIFVEINGRFWGSLPLAIACGADFPAYLFDLLVAGRRDFLPDYRIGLSCRNLVKDIHWLRETLSDVRRDRRRFAASSWQMLKECRYVLTFRERSDTLVSDDPRPGFVEIAQGLHAVAGKVKRRIRSSLLSARPVRALCRLRVRRAVRRARKVMFVCKGNICRSPLAESYARTRFPESVEILSSGYYHKVHRPCPPHAIEAAGDMGVDLSGHRSSVLDETAVRQADVLFTFDDENWELIVSRFPFARRRTFRLGMMTPSGPIHIRDPYGGALPEFRDVYRRIKAAVDSLAEDAFPHERDSLPHRQPAGTPS